MKSEKAHLYVQQYMKCIITSSRERTERKSPKLGNYLQFIEKLIFVELKIYCNHITLITNYRYAIESYLYDIQTHEALIICDSLWERAQPHEVKMSLVTAQLESISTPITIVLPITNINLSLGDGFPFLTLKPNRCDKCYNISGLICLAIENRESLYLVSVERYVPILRGRSARI